MVEQRGRPSRSLPLHPNRVLAQAIKTGLSTTVFIQGALKNSTTHPLFKSSRRIWLEAKANYLESTREGVPAFDHITEAENNIRKNSLQLLYEKAAAYGNKESTRAKSRDDTVGPLNQHFNIGGAALREFAMTLYPFPNPFPLGNNTVGYEKSSQGPEVMPIHTMLPEMDFIDSCRTQIQVLSTHSYIFDVPNNDSRRYCNLFLLRAKSYLDYLYSEHRCGQGDFRVGTLRVLRQLKNEIASFYHVRAGDNSTVTSRQAPREPEFALTFFEKQIEEAERAGVFSVAVNELRRILEGSSITETVLVTDDKGNVVGEKPAPCLTNRDVEHLWRALRELAMKRGSQAHRHIAAQFPSFWNVRRAILNENLLNDCDDGYLLAAEIPLNTEMGRGRADLILFRRESIPNGLKVLWRPVLILDVKTRVGFFWELGHDEKESESRAQYNKNQRVVVRFLVRTRPLVDTEWNAIIGSKPHDAVVEQVETYAKAILHEYQSIAGEDENQSILRGTLYLDAEHDIGFIRSLTRSFAVKVFESNRDEVGTIPLTLYELFLDGQSQRAAIVLHEQEARNESGRITIPPVQTHVYDPLQGAECSRRRFILYLAAKSPTSGGESAAWISKYYHGLQLLHGLAGEFEDTKVIWLDLADEFNEPRLAESRLRLRPYSKSEADVYRSQSRVICEFFSTTTVIGLYDKVEAYLFRGSTIPSLGHHLARHTTSRHIIVVSGWDRIRQATPEHYSPRLNRLLAGILDQLPTGSEISVIWFDSPVVAERGSAVYSRRALLPFRDSSPLCGETNEIVWNLPVAPEREVVPDSWRLPIIPATPFYDDIRVIIIQGKEGYELDLTQVLPLIGWSYKFRGEGLRFKKEIQSIGDSQSVPSREIRTRMKLLALDLVPWLPNLWPSSTIVFDGKERLVSTMLSAIKLNSQANLEQISTKSRALKEPLQLDPTILQRLKFRPKGFRGGKSYQSLTTGRINSQRLYRSPNRLKTKQRPVHKSTPKKELHSSTGDDHVFGQTLVLSYGGKQTTLLVSEDPSNSSRMLVGLFTEGSHPDQSGFTWSKNDVERLEEALQSLESMSVKNLLFRRIDDNWESWEKTAGSQDWTPQGFVELKTGRGGRVAALRAIREGGTVTSQLDGSEFTIPESFDKRVELALAWVGTRAHSTKHIAITLAMENDVCKVVFGDSEDDTAIHEVAITSTSDLIGLLRWPARFGVPMSTPNAHPIEWDPFNDIEYGELECIRPYVETSAPKLVGKPLPALLTDLVEPIKERTLRIILVHDREHCPLEEDGQSNHGACWHIRPLSSGVWIEKLFGTLLSGKEVYGLLSSTKILDQGVMYSLEIVPNPNRDDSEFYVFHEEYWIRRLFREIGTPLDSLPPGTYLKADKEKWMVDYNFEGTWVVWTAMSDITGKLWRSNTHRFELDATLPLGEAVSEFIGELTQKLSPERILKARELKVKIRRDLKTRGYGRSGPECRFEASRQGKEIKVALVQTGLRDPVPLHETSFKMDKMKSSEGVKESLLEMIIDGEIARYNIVNTTEFLEEFEFLLDELELCDESQNDAKGSMSEEEQLLKVIEELREEVRAHPERSEMLGDFLHKLAQLRQDEEKLDEALKIVEESIAVLERGLDIGELPFGEYSTKRRLAEARILKAELILAMADPILASEDKEELRELVRSAQTEITWVFPSPRDHKIINCARGLLDRINNDSSIEETADAKD